MSMSLFPLLFLSRFPLFFSMALRSDWRRRLLCTRAATAGGVCRARHTGRRLRDRQRTAVHR